MPSIWEIVKGDLGDKASSIHADNIQRYGPLPPGFFVQESNGKPQYVNPDTETSSPDHPLKDIGSRSTINFRDEVPRSLRVDVRGVSHPPVAYRAGEWQWEYYDIPARALFEALIRHGAITPSKEKAFKGRADVLSRETGSWTNEPLYHPGDRQSNVQVYHKEHMLAKMCREYQRELIIVAPEVWAEGKGRQLPYSCKPDSRPPVRMRRSVGEAEKWPPIILGIISPWGSQDRTGRWYVMVPLSERTKVLYKLWDSKCNWDIRRNELGLSKVSDLKTVQWLAVSAHRAVLNGEIKDTQLGPFIQALLKHYNEERSKPYGKRTEFTFNPKQDGPTVIYYNLTAYILTSGAESWARHYVDRYDNLMEAIDRGLHKRNPKAFMDAVKEITLSE
ncbi:hypothetical protein G6514_002206 [Epicoccum nigrum]|nr:hypothetical protein G6514_002206 [Epicoccum nigrum]